MGNQQTITAADRKRFWDERSEDGAKGTVLSPRFMKKGDSWPQKKKQDAIFMD